MLNRAPTALIHNGKRYLLIYIKAASSFPSGLDAVFFYDDAKYRRMLTFTQILSTQRYEHDVPNNHIPPYATAFPALDCHLLPLPSPSY